VIGEVARTLGFMSCHCHLPLALSAVADPASAAVAAPVAASGPGRVGGHVLTFQRSNVSTLPASQPLCDSALSSDFAPLRLCVFALMDGWAANPKSEIRNPKCAGAATPNSQLLTQRYPPPCAHLRDIIRSCYRRREEDA
jgi:hypothetical protein